MAIGTLFVALLGFLSSAHRGGLLQSVILDFTFMGAVAGHVAAKNQRSKSTIVVEIVSHFDGSLVSRDHIHLFLLA